MDNTLCREKSQPATFEVSEEAMAKAARVRDELERIELKASLLDLVYSLGKVLIILVSCCVDVRCLIIGFTFNKIITMADLYAFTAGLAIEWN